MSSRNSILLATVVSGVANRRYLLPCARKSNCEAGCNIKLSSLKPWRELFLEKKSDNIHALLCRLAVHRTGMFTNARLLMLMLCIQRQACDARPSPSSSLSSRLASVQSPVQLQWILEIDGDLLMAILIIALFNPIDNKEGSLK